VTADAAVIYAASFRAMLDALNERDKLSLPIGFRDFPSGSWAECPFVQSVVLSEQRQPRLRVVSSAGSPSSESPRFVYPSRLLITFLQCERATLHKPMLYLSHFLKRNLAGLLHHLQAVRDSGDWEGWLSFFLAWTRGG
jgi:hypothetical protein